MTLRGLFVATRFPEDNFTPARGRRWTATLVVLKRGIALARADSEIPPMPAATMAINSADMVSRLLPRRFVDLGLPGDPVVSCAVRRRPPSRCVGPMLARDSGTPGRWRAPRS
jgi:hypothetical protein